MKRQIAVFAFSALLAPTAGCSNALMVAHYPIMVRVVDATDRGIAGVNAEVTRIELPDGQVEPANATKGSSGRNGDVGLVVMTKVCYERLGRIRLSKERVIQRVEIQFEAADGRKTTRWFDGPFHHRDCGHAGKARFEVSEEPGEIKERNQQKSGPRM